MRNAVLTDEKKQRHLNESGNQKRNNTPFTLGGPSQTRHRCRQAIVRHRAWPQRSLHVWQLGAAGSTGSGRWEEPRKKTPVLKGMPDDPDPDEMEWSIEVSDTNTAQCKKTGSCISLVFKPKFAQIRLLKPQQNSQQTTLSLHGHCPMSNSYRGSPL